MSARRGVLALGFYALACGSQAIAPPPASAPVSDHGGKPTISIDAAPPYLEGFPMLLAVTVANGERGLLLSDLPRVGIFEDPLLLRWVARSTSSGEEQVLSSGVIPHDEEERGGFDLNFGEQQSMLVDLARVAPALSAGDYDLRVGYPLGEFVESEVIPFRVLAAAPRDAAFAARVLAPLPTEGRRWNTLVERSDAAFPVPPEDLSTESKRLVAWHRFVHRAVRDERSLSEQSLEGLEDVRGGPLDAEREVLRYELLSARGDESAEGLRQTIERQWPAWVWRIDAIDRGVGHLTYQRERWQRTRR